VIVAMFIGVVFVAALFYVWIDLGELIEEMLADEVGAGRVSQSGVVTSYGLTAEAATGADDWFGGDAA
jgi:hypothetical protein